MPKFLPPKPSFRNRSPSSNTNPTWMIEPTTPNPYHSTKETQNQPTPSQPSHADSSIPAATYKTRPNCGKSNETRKIRRVGERRGPWWSRHFWSWRAQGKERKRRKAVKGWWCEREKRRISWWWCRGELLHQKLQNLAAAAAAVFSDLQRGESRGRRRRRGSLTSARCLWSESSLVRDPATRFRPTRHTYIYIYIILYLVFKFNILNLKKN